MIPADATLNLLMGAATSGMTGAQREDQGEIVHDKVIGIVCKGRGGCRPRDGPPGVSIHYLRTEFYTKDGLAIQQLRRFYAISDQCL